MENYQELFSGQIILSELLLTMKTIATGGNFVCKLFDAFSLITQSVIYLTTQLFDEVFIVKPLKSRIVNSEKYLVGKSLKLRTETFDYVKKLLGDLHKRCTNDSSPLSLVPSEIMLKDEKFYQSARRACEEIIYKQTKALQLVMDVTEEEKKEGQW